MTRVAKQFGVAAGLAAAGLTAALLVWPGMPEIPGEEAFLMFGMILGSIPFGGLHNPAPEAVLIPLASLLNALLWGAAVAGLVQLITQIRRVRRLPENR